VAVGLVAGATGEDLVVVVTEVEGVTEDGLVEEVTVVGVVAVVMAEVAMVEVGRVAVLVRCKKIEYIL
tara:strand:+ start:97 stop:300 length:204 start_codon:yes stop_codon:yes gene_type:complete